MEKMTYVKALEVALNCEALSAEVREKLSALRDQQVKRNSAEKKPTKTQQANEGVKSHVLDVLASCDKPVTVSELMQADEELSQLSNQKVASLVRQLVEAGKVQRLEEKRKAYFTLVKCVLRGRGNPAPPLPRRTKKVEKNRKKVLTNR